MASMTREGVIAAAKSLGRKYGDRLTSVQLRDEAGISAGMVRRLFPKGQFLELRRLAGLGRAINPSLVKPETALEEFHRVAVKLGGLPSWSLFRMHARFGPQVLMQRFGGRAGLNKAYDRWLAARGEKRPGPALKRKLARLARKGPPSVRIKAARHSGDGGRNSKMMTFGPTLDFRGLLHEPANEMGVIYLFGAAAEDLGFMVDGFRAAFPDCEAKRLVCTTRRRWERCLIEFELLSSNFQAHGHDPTGCDLVVCWEHDWRECPVPVLELKSEIRKMMAIGVGTRGAGADGANGAKS